MNSIKPRIADISRGIVPAGYQKHGKYGVFPEDWRITTLGEITSRLRERNGDSTDYPAYSINNQVGFIPQKEQFEEGSYDGLDKSSYRIVERGQFAYNPARINVGSIGVLKDCDKAIISSLYVCFDTSKDVCKSYLENWFRTTDFYKEIIRNTEGSVREYLFYENFSDIRIVLPPLEEQKRIAEILECCDRVIRLKRELIEEKKKQKKSLMQKLLNPDSGFRLPGFKGEWISYKISQIAKIESGGTPSTSVPEYWDGGIMWCTPSDVTSCSKYLHNTERTITESGLNNSSAVLLPVGSIVMCSRASVGPHAIITVPLATNQAFKSFICSESLNNEFWYYYLDTIVKDFQRLAGGNTFKEVSKYAVENFEVRIPEYREQQAIASVLSSADHELDLLEQDLTQWEQKKKSLAQLLLTGKVSV